MAKYGCMWNVYSDNSFSQASKIASFSGLIGVADTWDGVAVTGADLESDYWFFTRHIMAEYEQYSLGVQHAYTPADYPYNQWGLYYPLCWADDFNGVKGYWEVVLSNGNTVRIYGGEWPDPFSWSYPFRVTVTNAESGVIFDGNDTGLSFVLLPFGCPPQDDGPGTGYGGPGTSYQSSLVRDSIGAYGIADMGWRSDAYGHMKLRGHIQYGDESAQNFYTLVFAGSKSIDPYDHGDPTQPGGGNPDPPGPDEDTEFPPEPTSNIADSGMITLYAPLESQIKALANYLWSSNGLDINSFKKIFADPIDAILGLSVLPFQPTRGNPENVTVGNIATTVTMYKAAKQYETMDFQTVMVGKKYGSYLDFAPYTKVECYLPFIGTVTLDTNDVMGKTVHLIYRFDIVSGACCAMIAAGGKQLYTYNGQCAGSVPITGHDWTNVLQSGLTIATSLGSMIATGGVSAPTGIPAIASATINAVHQNIQKSGSLAGMGGMLGPLTPFIIVTRPRSAWPKDLNHFEGYPSFINSDISKLEGYTEVYKIHLENVPATSDELNEIERLLQEGVIL